MKRHRFVVISWDGGSQVFGCWRKAKVAKRQAERETYCASIVPYHGNAKTGSELEV
jgi:hypothetical protein